MARIALIVPVFNESGNISRLFEEVEGVFGTLPGHTYELLFVDDGSTDGSVREIAALKATGKVRCIELSRNFGKEAALSAGLEQAEGDAVILMDGDLQHPPSRIPDLIREWEAGVDVVIGVRKRNPDEGLVRRIGSRVFNYLMGKISDLPTRPGATDFRLLDRAVVTEFKRFTEHGRMTRGLIDWLGFRRAYVEFDAGARYAGTVQYGYRKLIGLGFSALLAHSLLPLRLASYLGLPITVFAGGLGLFIIVEQLLLGDPMGMDISPIGMIAVMILFLNGILLICLGLISLYIEKIHRDTINRPLYVLRAPRK